MKKSQLKQLIGSTLREILAEKESETDKLLNMKIKNPETGNDIKLKSALGYPEDSQVYKAAKAAHDKATDIVGDTSAETSANVTEKPGDTKQIASAGGNNVLIAKRTEDHIARHNQPGEGSTFGKDINMADIQNAIKDIPEEFYEKGGGVHTTTVPNAGHNLVQKSSDILKKYPDAEKVMINKQVGFDREKKEPIMKAVPGYVVDADIDEFKTDQLSVVVRPSNGDYMDDELKNDPGVKQDLKGGKSHSVLTSFPGDPDVPPAGEWEDSDHAIIIPNGGKDADRSNWVTSDADSSEEPEATEKPEPEETTSAVRADMGEDEMSDAAEKEFNGDDGKMSADSLKANGHFDEVENAIANMAAQYSDDGYTASSSDVAGEFVGDNEDLVKKIIGPEYAEEWEKEGDVSYEISNAISQAVHDLWYDLDLNEAYTKPIKLKDLIRR